MAKAVKSSDYGSSWNIVVVSKICRCFHILDNADILLVYAGGSRTQLVWVYRAEEWIKAEQGILARG
jgi:hypothetical protein